ncbi:MAG: hypothetical protein A2312_00460 [Candidatus Staskawiczbacteria bacterium RIFOXYB2_FULL_32_9]|uniref:Transcription regulator TrmB N-terminal domain-containing protein n=1 Tax=Candidatus Staskawiczbacteria bacterium RIFOXYD1_FULL_32_13 TaxID=1802234 RepID=A0A1G2JN37_9BACT|nr:MAG: hypothetical protein UR22_C0001G0077 [Parcubacteria group bacterium GW2011_GWC2_32_10]OGZ78278.1 MAG: hypothetical protein A2360_03875 [Candidatus Staskawiczbacteria bacterium RIFOXYB1_FULL_32_11]OGZ84564.1 MAG: hypothetical protein A2312_00460 [Candidatus Staskawiczbacteria bacterium RIFOXYB2_FULL_32_9]OGZ87257.1 MAG: hypothetical protein A2463_02760 [Candidatus Staskawiczbacteria bacterium RIFOXYC2_FULL_32_10]OGZ87710.1 MAG: hypothetical protein A2561_03395 [Candidatus Staskawiczbacte
MINSILKEIGFSDNCIRIYTRLLETGYSSARQLAENLNMPRPTIYDNLRLLIDSGLVTEKIEDNKKLFGADDVKNLQHLIHTKIDDLKKKDKMITDILPTLNLNIKALEPKIKFYSGTTGIKQVLKDMLWYKDIESLSMWPISEMVKILGKEYHEDLNRRRIRQNISVKAIWPNDNVIDAKINTFLGVGKKHKRKLRLAPRSMTWNMGYWLYADKVAFVSSKNEGFGFLIHSQEFSDLIRVQFEQIWKISKPIKLPSKYSSEFLKTV